MWPIGALLLLIATLGCSLDLPSEPGEAAMNFYLVRGPDLWGDYGGILASGMSAHLGRSDDGLIQIERTGPFVPPISFPGPGDIVVTSQMRNALESAGLADVTFKPVIKKHIVEYRWQNWDRSAEIPEYPPGGEPENYILMLDHSPQAAKEMGELWELELPRDATAERRNNEDGFNLVIHTESWTGSHIFRPKGVRFTVVSEQGKSWLQTHAGEWVTFESCIVE
jgi:hypothetical protein